MKNLPIFPTQVEKKHWIGVTRVGREPVSQRALQPERVFAFEGVEGQYRQHLARFCNTPPENRA